MSFSQHQPRIHRSINHSGVEDDDDDDDDDEEGKIRSETTEEADNSLSKYTDAPDLDPSEEGVINNTPVPLIIEDTEDDEDDDRGEEVMDELIVPIASNHRKFADVNEKLKQPLRKNVPVAGAAAAIPPPLPSMYANDDDDQEDPRRRSTISNDSELLVETSHSQHSTFSSSSSSSSSSSLTYVAADGHEYLRMDLGEDNMIGNSVIFSLSKRIEDNFKKYLIHSERYWYHEDDLDSLLKQVEQKWFTDDNLKLIDETKLLQEMKKQYVGAGAEMNGVIDSDEKNGDHIMARYKQAVDDIRGIKHLLELHELLQTGDHGLAYKDRLAKLQNVTELTSKIKLHTWEALQIINNKKQVTMIESVASDLDEMITAKKMENLVRCQAWVLIQCRENHYQKHGNWVYKEVITNGKRRHAFAPYMTIENFVHSSECINREKSLPMWKEMIKCNKRLLIENLINFPDIAFPKVKSNTLQYSYRNCIHDAEKDHFIPYQFAPDTYSHIYIDEDITLPPGYSENKPFTTEVFGEHYWKEKRIDPVTHAEYRVYRDLNGRIKHDTRRSPERNEWKEEPTWKRRFDIKTLFLSKIMVEQNWPPEVQLWAFGMAFGRLAFPLSKGDLKQICVLFYGKGGCGKSTMAEHMLQMFHNEEVFYLQSNGQVEFGLETAIGKRVWTTLELKQDTNLPASFFQQMCEGSCISIDRKFKTKEQIYWDMPGLVVGNEYFPWKNSKSAITRRVLPFLFNVKLMVTDSQMKQRLKKTLPDDIRKSILIYLNDLKPHMHSRGIWTPGVLPEYFHQASVALSGLTDDVSEFIQDKCKIIRKLNSLTNEQDTEEEIQKYDEENIRERGKFLMPFEIFMKELRAGQGKNTKTHSTRESVCSTLEQLGLEIFYIGKHTAGDNSENADLDTNSINTTSNGCEPYEGFEADLAATGAISQPKKRGFATIAQNIVSVDYLGTEYSNCLMIAGLTLKSMQNKNGNNIQPQSSFMTLEDKIARQNAEKEERKLVSQQKRSSSSMSNSSSRRSSTSSQAKPIAGSLTKHFSGIISSIGLA